MRVRYITDLEIITEDVMIGARRGLVCGKEEFDRKNMYG